jgi:negative regulator of replication initiation
MGMATSWLREKYILKLEFWMITRINNARKTSILLSVKDFHSFTTDLLENVSFEILYSWA